MQNSAQSSVQSSESASGRPEVLPFVHVHICQLLPNNLEGENRGEEGGTNKWTER